ncbi:MAG: CDGSH iron-sulfur domain-containing protein [Gammaproteobacteria bacterium]|nr:CDGSH iron-sulfur domain-containing protein [Gammaproteobacteria bacterium]
MAVKNIITVLKDGPLQVQGNFRVYNTIGELVEYEGEMLLCRCGASKNKPLCDGSHTESGFTDSCIVDSSKGETSEQATVLVISCRPDGMLVAKGPMIIVGTDGQSKVIRNKAALCRCGASRTKPFCDISHKKIDFKDDALLSKTEEQ